MKKIYSLLLLGGLLFFGVQNASADYLQVKTGPDSWEGHEISWNNNIGTVDVDFAALTQYEFKISNNSNVWHGCNATIKSDVSDYGFRSGEDAACKLQTQSAGAYHFSLFWHNNNNEFKVSVTYPEGSFSASFEKPNGWGTLYAYVWTGESPNKTEQLGDWPGTEAVDGGISFNNKIIPANIIWTDNRDGHYVGNGQTGDLVFVNGMTYKEDGTKSYKLSLTAGTWTSFCPAVDVTIPDDARLKVYRAQLVNTTLTAYEVTGKIKADEGVLLKATEGATYTFDETTGATAIENNSLKGTSIRDLRTALQGNATYMMVLAGGTNTFKSYTADYLPANKAYILYTPIQGAPSIISLVEEESNATNINNIESSEEAVKFFQNGKLFIKKNGIVYDMMGTIVK